jgi:DNA-directed RNA polymerase specialized sigma24 family protein
MADLDLSDVDAEEVLKKLTLYARRLFFVYCGLTGTETALQGVGTGPDDLAVATLLKFLDPEDYTVTWKQKHGTPTTAGVVAYLRTVLKNDFLDLLKAKAHETTVIVKAHQEGEHEQDEDRGSQRTLTLDEFASAAEGPEGKAIREQMHARLLAQFEEEPDLRDLLEAQLDPDGYRAYTNQDLALLLLAPPGETLTPDALAGAVSEIENRKKRLDRRLRKILAEMQSAREGKDG